MEDVLDLYAEPYDPKRPVVCFDETSKQLVSEKRSPIPAKAGLEAYLHFYNTQRPHQAQGYRTPAEVFSGDSVQSDEQSKERRWLPTRALVDLGKTAGPSLNIAPILSN